MDGEKGQGKRARRAPLAVCLASSPWGSWSVMSVAFRGSSFVMPGMLAPRAKMPRDGPPCVQARGASATTKRVQNRNGPHTNNPVRHIPTTQWGSTHVEAVAGGARVVVQYARARVEPSEQLQVIS